MDFVQLIRLLMRRLYPLLVGLVLGGFACTAFARAPIKTAEPELAFWKAQCQNAVNASGGYWQRSTAYNIDNEYWTIHYERDGYWDGCHDVPIVSKCEPVPPSTAYGAPDTSKPLSQQCPDPPFGCVAPFEEVGGKCVDPCSKDKGKTVGLTVPAESSPINVCSGNCEMTVSNAEVQKVKGPGGKLFTRGSWVNSGSMGRCDPQKKLNDPNPLPDGEKDSANPPNPGACAAQGKSWVEMNGVTQCVSPSVENPLTKEKTTQTTKTEKVTNPDGTTQDKNQVVTTKTTEVDNGDGDPDVTTTTTTTDGTGKTTEQSTTANKTTFCQENPSLSLCKTSGFSQTPCGNSGPSCEGDAVLCATALQTWTIKCALAEQTAAGELGLKLASGDDPDKAAIPDSSKPVETDVSQLMQNAASNGGVLGSGQCIPDRTYSVSGHSFTIPYGQTCPYFELIGKVVIGGAMFASMFIIGKGN